MNTVHLFDLAAQQRDWLSMRQAAVSQNIANSSTPGYRRVDVQAFEAALKTQGAGLTTSHPAHLDAGGGFAPDASLGTARGWETSHSGNTVLLEQEMLAAAEVSRLFAMNTNITRSFHDMMLAGLRG
jgi:flagellar basal-body rod protein FlgB